jgi:hypothetical protein
MEAIKLTNSGHRAQAARRLQETGNQCRHPDEKAELWADGSQLEGFYERPVSLL